MTTKTTYTKLRYMIQVLRGRYRMDNFIKSPPRDLEILRKKLFLLRQRDR